MVTLVTSKLITYPVRVLTKIWKDSEVLCCFFGIMVSIGVVGSIERRGFFDAGFKAAALGVSSYGSSLTNIEDSTAGESTYGSHPMKNTTTKIDGQNGNFD